MFGDSLQIKGFSSWCGAETQNQILRENQRQQLPHLADVVLNDNKSVRNYKAELLDKTGQNMPPLFVDTLQSATPH